jgi:hypothetical protein
MAALDDYGDVVWSCALAVGTPTTSTAATIDVDGPVLRGLFTSIDLDLDHLTLCPED